MTPAAPAANRLRERVPSMAPTLVAARRLAEELCRLGIPADVNGDGETAMVSVWRGLFVCVQPVEERLVFRWWTGSFSPPPKDRPVYGLEPADRPQKAARRVAYSYLELCRKYPGADMAAAPDAGLRWRL